MAFEAGGAISGASLGAGVGSFGGPIGIGIGAGVGGLAGALGAFGKTKKPQVPNIGAEMARISELFEQLKAQTTANINREAGQGRKLAASNLAGRGVYRSGVSENTFGALEGERLNSIATANAQLAGQEAGMRSALLSQLLGLNMEAQNREAQAGAARTGAITGIGSNLLLAQLMRARPAPAAAY